MNWIFLNVSEVIEAWIFFVFDSSCWCVTARDRIHALFTFRVYLYWSESDFNRPQRSCGRLCFYRCLSVERGGSGIPSMPCKWYSQHALQQVSRGGACSGCLCVCGGDPPASRWLLMRTVHILLECILVFFDLIAAMSF